jgi:rare lipoprotein A
MKPAMVVIVLLALLSACTAIPERQVIQDDVDVSAIPDAVPKMEPLSEEGNPESYVQGGKRYWILPNPYNFRETGLASWYGPKFHGKRTSSGEVYDMYKMTAAHKTLPLPTYVRVTNLSNNKSVILKVNDRGPFKDERIIDLSYVAAKKLAITGNGTAQVEVRVIDPMQFSANADNTGDAQATPLTQSTPMPAEAIPASPNQPQTKMENTPPSEYVSVRAGSVSGMDISPDVSAKEATQKTIKSKTSAEPEGMPKQIFVQVGAFGSAENAARLRAELSEIQSYDVVVDSSGGPQGILHRVHIGPFDSEEKARMLEAPLRNHGIEKFQIIHK